jgi:hypothetical protein
MEVEFKGSLQIFMTVGSHERCVFGCFSAQFALAFALMQIAQVGLGLDSIEWLPHAMIGRELQSICRCCELRIGS